MQSSKKKSSLRSPILSALSRLFVTNTDLLNRLVGGRGVAWDASGSAGGRRAGGQGPLWEERRREGKSGYAGGGGGGAVLNFADVEASYVSRYRKNDLFPNS